ncbi:hypothetical protein F4V57_10005 [Acinetobacter qingfengensis]|uniref:Uncharacterized protein n=1 Tax=Acinetobacter qingfengensis TaxID=1262585 RepID=A0A1E7R4U3_9GAMM|nr:AciT family ciprofloxacin tolerance protein [Acinetobacter qingfengensis]KAA8732394.1 hypothetical protein F4V57_10005 [Acinetobacter qingfengensis]OEY94389.1 hypothetical protein BJI46_03340 [Acinetobacter qingfengensis]
MTTMSMATVLGLSCVALAICLIAFSRYRHWLLFMGAGMVFWGGLELLRVIIQSLIDMPLLYGYITAFMLSLLGITGLIIWYDRQHSKVIKKVKCIEHTPVYEDDQHHYLR